MWPWEHAALGYLLYSLGLRVSGRSPPSDAAALLVLVATQFPDLVDKPLSWGLGVFTTGFALGHSVFLAVPLGVLGLAWAGRAGRRRLGVAATVGYWSHLAADVLDPVRYGEPPAPARVLWPVVTGPPYDRSLGLGRGVAYLAAFVDSLSSLDPVTLLVVYLLLPLGTVALWLADGVPGLAAIGRGLAWAARRRGDRPG